MIKDVASFDRSIFAQLMTMWEKQLLAKVVGIQKEYCG